MINLKINSTRLWDSIQQMGAIGATKAGGCSRLALTELDKQARDLFINWCKDAGCSIGIDEIGNIYATRAGTEADLLPISTGSHLDTQPVGGKFDGIYGCLAGLEVVRCLQENNVVTRRPLQIVIWTNEEGARFSPTMIASAVYAGKISLAEALAQKDCSGQLIPDSILRFSSATTGEMPPLYA